MVRYVTAAAIFLMTCSTAFAQFVAPGGTIPVVANNQGRNGTVWRSDVYILNVGLQDTSVVLLLFPEIQDGVPAFEARMSDLISVPVGTQKTLTNVVQSVFGLIETKGGLAILPLGFEPLVINSRTYNIPEGGGSFGQQVTGNLIANIGWVSGVRNDSLFRTNVGVFLPSDPDTDAGLEFVVTVYNAAGLEVASGTMLFTQAGLQQRALATFLAGPLNDGYLTIQCADPSYLWYGYASRVDQITGDGVHRNAIGRQSDLP